MVNFKNEDTTRKPRGYEVNGKEYYFVSREEFMDIEKKGGFIETTNYAGNLYGTSVKMFREFVETRKIPILDIDINGVKTFHSMQQKNLLPHNCEVKYIFIKTSSLDILEKRLRDRNTNSETEITNRMRTASQEVRWAESQNFFDYTIVNDDLELTYKRFKYAMCH